ncbi:hypothetical protein EVAR_36221_1 [Eumeta japonica]|uniref:Uncharacterized protein n=1 Tax=Eumeta variegata TaxID=151549 RepID=A0A4C1VS03_EUMVA|nr:hypothetical protein EVAR_36221_1 [Eumeta japonica]
MRNLGPVFSRQRPAAHATAWRSRIERQLTWITTSPASASTNHIANTSGASRRGRARRPWGQRRPSCVRVLPNTRAAARARCAPTGLRIICDYPQLCLRPDIHHRTKADVAINIKANLLKCRRLGTAATLQVQSALVRPPPAPTGRRSVRRAARLPRCGRCAYPTSWEQLFYQEPMPGAPRRSERRPRRGPEREEEDTGSLTHAWLSAPPPPPSSTICNPVPPPAAERMRTTRTPAGGPA